MSPILSYDWNQQRTDVQAAVNTFFGRKINITPRAMAAFQSGATVDEPDTELDFCELLPVFEYCIMESLMQSSPACWSLLSRSGLDPNQMKVIGQRPEPGPLGEDTLAWIFQGVEAEELTATARRIRRRGTLTDLDLLTSSLEASLQGTEPTAFGDSVIEALGLRAPHFTRDYDPTAWKGVDSGLRKLLGSVDAVRRADPSHAYVQFVLYEDDSRRLRLRPFGAASLTLLKEFGDLKGQRHVIYRDGLIQPLRAVVPGMPSEAVERFEDLLNTRTASETDFQSFFREYPFLLTGLDFRFAHPQPILYKDDGSKLIPDFFLEKMTGGWDAIVDLKRPYDEMVVRRRNRTYFQQSLHNAVAQLRFYHEWFESPTNRRTFEEQYGARTFRPKMVIVIGRRHHFLDDVERLRLLTGLPERLELWTYDDLLDKAKRYADLLKPLV